MKYFTDAMTPIYFDTRFKLGLPLAELPDSFVIIPIPVQAALD